MSELVHDLHPRHLGAEVLGGVARERRDGELIWFNGEQESKILFKGGRPEAIVDAGGESSDRQRVVAAVRAFAAAAEGRCTFAPLSREVPVGLGVDTLGETLVALALGLSPEQLASIWAARGTEVIENVTTFERFAAALVQVGGSQLVAPTPGVTIGALVGSATVKEQRAWAALISLGVVTTTEPSPAGVDPEIPATGAAQPSVPPAVAAPAPETGPQRMMGLPEDLEARGLALEIERMYRKLPRLDLYEVLDVESHANTETIREAYFEVAKRWHSDRFKGFAVGDVFEHKAEEIFRRAGEAWEILGDTEKRKSYDFVEARKAQGLPTDVNVILEAEGLFRKGQALVRRGQAAQAEAVLRQAVEMNKGEAEFLAYLGFAIYSAQGSAKIREAREAIKQALEMNAKLDVAHEFLGRIARVEGNVREARRELTQAIEMNPKNVDAERELRLLNLRAGQKEEKGKGLFGGLFKR